MKALGLDSAQHQGICLKQKQKQQNSGVDENRDSCHHFPIFTQLGNPALISRTKIEFSSSKDGVVGEKSAVTPDSVWQLGKLASTSFSVTEPKDSHGFPQIAVGGPQTQFVSRQMEREMRQRLLLRIDSVKTFSCPRGEDVIRRKCKKCIYVQDKNRDGIWLNLFELSNDDIQFYSSWRYQILTGSSFPHCWFQWYLLSCRPALAFVMFLAVIFCHCRSSHHLSVTRSRNSLPPGIQHRVSTHSHSQL